MECCSSPLCNNKGCSQSGYPSNRGPICFDCQNISDPTLCDKLKVCEVNQACYLQKEVESGNLHYTYSCINKQACTSSVDIFGKRNIDGCSKCCLTDLCNIQCDGIPSSLTTLKTTTSNPTQLQTYTGNIGREFLILFMRNRAGSTGNLSIYITTENETEVTITSSPNLDTNLKSSVDKTFNITSESLITLPLDLQCEYMKIEPKGIFVRTTEVSNVTIFDSLNDGTSDGTLIIPTNKLSTKYLVSSTEPFDTSMDLSQFALLPLHDRTKITITLKMKKTSSITLLGNTYGDGDTVLLNLDRLETFQIGHTTDLSGTFISATKPIAVFSGNRCHRWSDLSNDCSHMLTELPPANELDNDYVIPSLHHNKETLLQVISENQTFINCSIGLHSALRWHSNASEFKDISYNELTLLVSEKPILVVGFGMGFNSNNSHMTVIPGVNQYVNYYKITVPDGYTENFMTVIIPIDSEYNLRINGGDAFKHKLVKIEHGGVGKIFYQIFTFQVEMGTYVITTTDHSTFGLIVYGHRTHDGYAFAGNVVLP
ncbi:IgGFc-binding protein-like [Saccostrea cucullata]|uniref:IgGFc-binding protein-like n=1 Tax=Saccostrea cuccullata TaxID=36930 RepID=UPI002ED177CF